MLELLRLAEEMRAIDASLKELAEAGTSVDRTEKIGLKCAGNSGFYQNLRIKIDQTVQRNMEKLDGKSEELDILFRRLMCMSMEAPKMHNFEQEMKIVVDYCGELQEYLRSDRSGMFPVLELAVEKSIRRVFSSVSA